jgi:hypothetical protein
MCFGTRCSTCDLAQFIGIKGVRITFIGKLHRNYVAGLATGGHDAYSSSK